MGIRKYIALSLIFGCLVTVYAASMKISDLDPLTAPAAGDVLPIVDVSGTPTTKKITLDDLFDSGLIDHDVLTSTGTLTHTEIESQLSTISGTAVDLSADIAALSISTAANAANIASNAADIVTLSNSTDTLNIAISGLDLLLENEITSLSTTYLAIDGSNANQAVSLGAYGVNTSSDVTANAFHGDGSGLTGITSDHSALSNLNWSAAGHTFDTNVDLNGYDIAVGSITGYGGDLTGIAAGVDIAEGATPVILSTDTVNFLPSYFKVTATGVDLDTDTLKTAIDTMRVGQYTKVVGYTNDAGIDYVCDGTADDVQISAAIDSLSAGQSLYIMPGFTYDITTSKQITTSDLYIESKGAVLKINAAGIGNLPIFEVLAGNVKFRGLEIDGSDTISSGMWWNTTLQGGLITECYFHDIGSGGTGRAIYTTSTAERVTLDKLFFNECNTTIQTVWVRGGACSITNLAFRYCPYPFSSSGNLNAMSAISYQLSTGNQAIVIDGIGPQMTNCGGSSTGNGSQVQWAATNGSMSNCRWYGSGTNDMLYVTGSDNHFSGVDIYNAGATGGSDDDSGVYITGDRNTFIEFSFTGICDLYAFEIAATADLTKIAFSQADTATSMVAFLSDLGTNTSVFECSPDTPSKLNQGLALPNRTTAQLIAITPRWLGETYWNTDTFEFWAATGTAVNQFIHK